MNGKQIGRMALPLLLAPYLAWVLSHWHPACVAPDAVGLCQQAQHFADSGLVPFRPESPAQLVGTHWVEVHDGTYWGRFPPGYPLLLGLAYRLVGPGWSLLLGPFLGMVAVGLIFGMGRSLWRRGDEREHAPQGGDRMPEGTVAALLAALLLATLPLQNRLVLHGDTHVPAVVCVLAGIWLLHLWEGCPSRRRAFAAGLTWGFLPSLRYGEVVMSLAAGAFMLLRGLGRRDRAAHRGSLGSAVAGAGVPLGLLSVYNSVAFGSPWRTGYALTNEQTAFGLSLIPSHFGFYLTSLLAQPVLAAFSVFGLYALGVMLLDRESRPVGLFLLSAILLSVALYVSYYWGDMEYASLALRFFLPSLACLLVAITWVLARARGRGRWLARASAVALIVLGAVHSETEMREEGLALRGGSALVAAARQAVPAGSVLICPRGLGETLSYEGLWHMVPQWLFPGDPQRDRIVVPWEVTPELLHQRALRPAPMQATRGAALRSHYRSLGDSALVRAVLTDVRRWQPSSAIYWIGDPSVVARADMVLNDQEFRALGYMVLPGWSEEEANAEGPSRISPRIPIFVLEAVSTPEGSSP